MLITTDKIPTTKTSAIIIALNERKNAILIPSSHTKVGACLYSEEIIYYGLDGKAFWSGYNIQNHSHKSYHAEEMAVLNYMVWYQNNKDYIDDDNKKIKLKGIVVTFDHEQIKDYTFCCGHCRQVLWEYLRNPDLLVTEVDLEGNIIAEKTLGELYPNPYPR